MGSLANYMIRYLFSLTESESWVPIPRGYLTVRDRDWIPRENAPHIKLRLPRLAGGGSPCP